MKGALRRARTSGVGLLLAIAIGSTTSTAHADASLDYTAPEECPTESDVAEKMKARRAPDERARIAIAKTADGFHGDLVLVAQDGTERTRRGLDARTCGAVVEAIALVAALAPAAASVATIADADGAATAPASTDDVTASPPPAVAESAPAARPAETTASSTPPPTTPRRTQLTVGASPFTATTWGSDRVLVGFSGFFEAAPPSRILGSPLLEPSVRMSVGATLPTRSGDRSLSSGGLCVDCGPQVRLVTLSLDVCPIGAGHRQRVSFAACAHAEAGTIIASNGAETGSDARLWAAVGPLARARFVVSPRTRGGEAGDVFVEVLAAGEGALRRDAFFFYNVGSAFLTPPWLWSGGLGIGAVLQ